MGADTLKGEDGDDTLSGVNGKDSLIGGVGNDKLDGGFDNDTLEGGEGDDFVYGSYGDDTVRGGAGADRIGGGQGQDVAYGFVDGEDLLLVPFAFDEITIAQDGADTVISYDDEWSDGLSTLRLIGVDAASITIDDFLYIHQGTNESDVISGGSEGDFVDGGAGDDNLSGGGGGDAMAGGGGDDTYVVDVADTVGEDAGGGVDTIMTSGSYALGENLENLVLTDAAAGASARGALGARPLRVDAWGNGLDNAILGSSGANRILGMDGKDKLNGAGGNDTLLGGAGNDKLSGGDGKDVLWGDSGRDVLTGGTGADLFVFKNLKDSGDTIRDFAAAQRDVIDLSGIDAKTGKSGDQAFSFTDAFHGKQGEAVLTYDAGKDRTVLQLDVNGDAAADFFLILDGQVTAGDGWVL